MKMDILVPTNLNQDRLDRIRAIHPDGRIHTFDIPLSVKALRYFSRSVFPYPLYLLSKRIFEGDSVKILINRRSIKYPNKDIHIMYSSPFLRHSWIQNILPFLPNLKWVHSLSTGVDHLVCRELIDRNVVLTNGGPVYSKQIAEFVMSLIFAFAKNLRNHIILQSKKRCKHLTSMDIRGKTVGIIGLGNIGKELAQLAESVGLSVLAIRKNPQQEASAFPVWPPDKLDALLQASDFVVLCLPLTDETYYLIGERELRLMKETAYLINIARGNLIDERSLIMSLKKGHIAGAALDVTTEHKVPRFSPLYSTPNLLLTSYCSFNSEKKPDENFDIFLNNLVRYQKGESLFNIIDIHKGY